jgi:hypothetical protein
MSIRFKSFRDHTKEHCGTGMLGSTCIELIRATTQAEDFINENNVQDVDIKFSVDGKGNEHILLVYTED